MKFKTHILLLLFIFLEALIFCQEETKNKIDPTKNIEVFESNTSEFLVPPVSIVNDQNYSINYQRKIKTILLEGTPEYFDMKYLSIPSFDYENALVISENEIFYNIAKKHIWGTFYDEILDKTGTVEIKRKIRVKKHKNKILKKDADLLNKLYFTALSKARYLMYTPKQLKSIVIGTDGTSYSFSLNNNGIMEGVTCSPKKGSKMFRLIAIHKKLIEMIINSRPKSEIILDEHLISEINNLIIDMNR